MGLINQQKSPGEAHKVCNCIPVGGGCLLEFCLCVVFPRHVFRVCYVLLMLRWYDDPQPFFSAKNNSQHSFWNSIIGQYLPQILWDCRGFPRQLSIPKHGGVLTECWAEPLSTITVSLSGSDMFLYLVPDPLVVEHGNCIGKKQQYIMLM